MMSRGVITCRVAVAAGSRFFSTTGTTARALASKAVVSNAAMGFSDQIGASRANLGYWLRVPLVRSGSVRNSSTISVEQKEKQYVSAAASSESSVVGDNDGKGVVSYWGIEPAKITKADGTEWRWNSFRPWETYRANVSIDLKKHHTPATYLDKMAYWTVKVLRWPTDIFFQVVYKFGSSNSDDWKVKFFFFN